MIERAHSLANEAVHMVALQHRRLQSNEPEDETFIFRRWADFQFLIVSLRRLRLTALLAARSEANRAAIESAISEFDEALPDLRKMRNVGEHLDEYAIEDGRESQRESAGTTSRQLRQRGAGLAWRPTRCRRGACSRRSSASRDQGRPLDRLHSGASERSTMPIATSRRANSSRLPTGPRTSRMPASIASRSAASPSPKTSRCG